MKTVGEKLREARKRKGLNQTDVARILDCVPTSLTNWETGKIQPSMDVLSRLCEIYEISPLSLLDRAYSYEDLVEISGEPVPERTYEDQIALTFSFTILNQLIDIERIRQETEQNEAITAFVRSTDLLERFGGSMGREQVEQIKADYDSYDGVDDDILFAFHALTIPCKRAFLSMLSGLISDDVNVQQFNEDMATAVDYTLDRLAEGKELLD